MNEPLNMLPEDGGQDQPRTDAICSVEFGPNPTATADSPRLAANSTESFLVPTGQAFKVAVITNT